MNHLTRKFKNIRLMYFLLCFILTSVILAGVSGVIALHKQVVHASEEIPGEVSTSMTSPSAETTNQTETPSESTSPDSTIQPNPINPSNPTPTPSPAPSNQGIAYLLVGENTIINSNVGEKIKLKLPLVNLGTAPAKNVSASPILSSKGEEFPFEIEKSEYLKSLDGSLSPVLDMKSISQSTKSIDFGDFMIRSNLDSGYYRVSFKINYKSGDSNTYEQIDRYLFIKVNNPNQPSPNKTPDIDPGNSFDPGSFGDGGYVGGDVGGPGSSGSESQSTPRLLITGFSTNPEKLLGGQEFELSLRVKNTSKDKAVKNIKITMSSTSEDTVFLPSDGASTIFIDSIAANTEQALTIKLKSNPVVPQKIYPLDFKFEYEDKNANPFTSEEMISLMLFQELRCDLSKIDIMPNPLTVNSEANVMFSIYNKGKAILYNLSVVIPEGVLEANEVYIGNVEPGTSKDVDFMIKAISTSQEDKLPFQITFEDAEGNPTTLKQEMTLTVNETMGQDDFFPDDGMYPGNDMYPDTDVQIAFPIWAYLLIGLVIIIPGSIILKKMLKKRKAKKEQAEIDEIL